jgi:transcriptional regulator with XRE-family HTH domain
MQVRAARALLAWSQQDLSKQAQVGTSTVADFERGHRTPIANNADAIRAALENAGISFLPGGAVIGPPPPVAPAARAGGIPIRWVSATDLSQWAERRDGQGTMPELLTRLIRAATGMAARIRFPSDESVQLAGWDGTCDIEKGTEHIPSGISGWEIGTQRTGINAKANEDYGKRTADPLGVTPDDATFVFVTPRRWPGKGKWTAARLKENKWRDVRAYDADDLVHWIELYPAVGQWLAVTMGRRPQGVRQLEEAWEEWSLSRQQPLTTELMLAGRDEDAARILRWLREGPSLLSVQGESPDEAVAFLYATIEQLPDEYRVQYYARSLIADAPHVGRALGESLSPLIIVLEDPEPGLARVLSERGHHVFAAYGLDAGVGDRVLQLSRPPRDALEFALTNMGFADDQARNLARDSARSLAVLRRLIPSAPGRIPHWATGTPPRSLAAALLAGAWDEDVDGDRIMLERLAGEKYDTISAQLAPLVGTLDQPLRKAGSVWKVASPRDAWFRLSQQIGPGDFERFESVAHDVLASRDPRFDMDPDDRWLANLKGVRPQYSEYLRRGLGETLILFSLFGGHARSVANAGARVDGIVQRLLEKADRERWWSLSRDFQLLAEAAPETFLAMLNEGLARDAPVTVLFGEDGGPFGGEHVSNLLWALESLAWSPRYLGQVCSVIAKLAARDPGGRWGNRPANSLRNIFLLWLPQTFAPLEDRFQVLDRLRKTEPDVAWKLMLGILPSSYDAASPSSHTRWRDLSVDRREEVTEPLIAKGAQGVAERLLADVGMAAARWTGLIEAFPNLSPEHRAAAVRLLRQAEAGINDDGQRAAIWDSLRTLLNHHRTVPDAAWALPGDELDAIEPVYRALEPRDPIRKFSWLFALHVRLPRPAAEMRGDSYSDASWRANEQEVANQRRAAVAELLAADGIDAVSCLAEAVQAPGYVGVAVAELEGRSCEQDAILVQALTGTDKHGAVLAHGIIATAFGRDGESWASALLTRAVSEKWSEEALYRILCALPETMWTWKQAEVLGEKIESLYWAKRHIHWINGETELLFAVEKLLVAHRAAQAIVLIGRVLNKDLPQELLLRTLAQAAQERWVSAENTDLSSFRHSVVEIFKKLDSADGTPDDVMASLEWAFLPSFRFSGRQALALQRALSTTPKFFVEVLRAVYRPSKESGIEEPPPADPERAHAIASQAYELLRDWRRVPGLTDAGMLDAVALEAWVREARALCAQAGREAVGDLHIGQILAAAPAERGGAWPAIAVREVIENRQSRELERGILTGVRNSRGATWRGMTDGGVQERERAAHYKRCAAETGHEWPRTAALLDLIAKSYEAEGEWHDQDAERMDWQ